MQLLHYSRHEDGVVLETSRGVVKLTPYTPKIIRVRYTLENEFNTRESLMVEAQPQQPITFDVAETGDDLRVFTTDLTIRINKQTTAFTYLDAADNILTKEPPRGGKMLDVIDVVKSVFDSSTEIEAQQGADGLRMRAEHVQKVVDRQAYHTKLEFEWADGEALYGLGSHEDGMMNLRGQHQYLYQQNMKAVVPVLVSTRGYGILLDSYSLATFHDDAFGSYLWTDVDDALDYYFILGPEFDQIVGGMRYLTGPAPMFPRWAFGYVQSKERYVSQEELIEVVKAYRERGLPLDCIVLDWQSWPGKLWGQKSFDLARFPDPARMMEEIHRLNAHLMISVWPTMNPDGDNWKAMHQQGYLLGNHATYDAYQEGARSLYWQQANDGLFAQGIDAWWCDCTEPFEADWKGAVRPEPEDRMRINSDEAKHYLDPEYINAYSLLHSQGIYRGQRQTTNAKRVVNLTRSSYAGQHRYGTITWSGDITASWDTLRKQIPAGLNFCVTGEPYWTLDIGAFFVKHRPDLWFWDGDYDRGVEDLGYRELYVRWFQYGAFLPMFRSHGTDTPREVWRFGDPGDPMYDALVKFLKLRYRLMPYLYSLAGSTTLNDYTMLRALAFDFRDDPATYDINDQYLFGPALLVNPVTHPMYFDIGSRVIDVAARTRPVYLPAGSEWYDFWTDERYSGGQTIVANATLDTMPLYVRAGSIIPMGPDIQYANEKPGAALEVHIYAGRDGSFTLYEDEGDNYNYEQGAFATIRVRWENQAQRLIVEQRQGSYPGMPSTREFHFVLHGASDVRGKRGTTSVAFEGQPITVEI